MSDPLAPAHEHHTVQLYGSDDDALAAGVGRFVSEGLGRGEGAIIIATSTHCEAFAAHLDAPVGLPALCDGRLLMLDSVETLKTFMVDGMPDRTRFNAMLGRAIATVRQGGNAGVCVYGEMVGHLFSDGLDTAAIALEDCWNRYMARGGIRLLCGYPIDVCDATVDPARVAPILCAHAELVPADGGLDRAVHRALHEVLGGTEAETVRAAMAAELPSNAPRRPSGEHAVLWLRDNLKDRARAIVQRAHFHRASLLADT